MSVQTPPDSPSSTPPPRDAKAELAAAKAYAKAARPWHKKKRFWALGLFALLVIISVASGGGDPASTTSNSEPNASTPPPAASPDPAPSQPSCTNKASEDCTPDVASNRAVRVDALTWSVVSSRTSKTLGDQEYGFGEKADDTFLVVTIKVKSNKNESATLTDEAIKLESSEGNIYSVDSEGTIAAIGSGEDSLLFEDLGPDQSHTSKVVFDVPQSVLDGGAKLRFNELGFGETHGYIALPRR